MIKSLAGSYQDRKLNKQVIFDTDKFHGSKELKNILKKMKHNNYIVSENQKVKVK